MSTLLIVLAVWCAVSVLFAAAHYRLVRYAEASRAPMVLRSTPISRPPLRPYVAGRYEMEPVGSDVVRFFGRFDDQQAMNSVVLSRN